MKKSITFLAVMLIVFIASADSIVTDSVTAIPYDSAAHQEFIVGTANAIIKATPLSDTVKLIIMGAGSLITGFFIGFFKKRNKKK